MKEIISILAMIDCVQKGVYYIVVQPWSTCSPYYFFFPFLHESFIIVPVKISCCFYINISMCSHYVIGTRTSNLTVAKLFELIPKLRSTKTTEGQVRVRYALQERGQDRVPQGQNEVKKHFPPFLNKKGAGGWLSARLAKL